MKFFQLFLPPLRTEEVNRYVRAKMPKVDVDSAEIGSIYCESVVWRKEI